jgi:hypothetical protein
MMMGDHEFGCKPSPFPPRPWINKDVRVTDRPDTNPKSAFGIQKPPMHLIPAPAMIQTAMVFKLGAAKYGPYNWRHTSVAASVYVSAAQRHLASWHDGESLDPESGQPHLAHVIACAAILLDAMAGGNLIDDRPPAGCAGEMIADIAAASKPAPVEEDAVLEIDREAFLRVSDHVFHAAPVRYDPAWRAARAAAESDPGDDGFDEAHLGELSDFLESSGPFVRDQPDRGADGLRRVADGPTLAGCASLFSHATPRVWEGPVYPFADVAPVPVARSVPNLCGASPPETAKVLICDEARGAYWRNPGAGMTRNPTLAHRFDRAAALEIVADTPALTLIEVDQLDGETGLIKPADHPFSVMAAGGVG